MAVRFGGLAEGYFFEDLAIWLLVGSNIAPATAVGSVLEEETRSCWPLPECQSLLLLVEDQFRFSGSKST